MAFFENKIVAFSILIILFTVIGVEGTQGAPCIIKPQAVVEAGRAAITCSFPSVNTKNYILIKFKANNSSEKIVVSCDFQTQWNCQPRLSDYEVNQTTIVRNLTLILPRVFPRQSGLYYFQQNQQDFHCTCNLTVTATTKMTTTTTSTTTSTTRKPPAAPSTTSSLLPLFTAMAIFVIIFVVIFIGLVITIYMKRNDIQTWLKGALQDRGTALLEPSHSGSE